LSSTEKHVAPDVRVAAGTSQVKGKAMEIGPVEYMVIGFPENRFTGEIAPELAKLVSTEVVRILDLIFIGKQSDGTVVSFEFDQLDELAPFGEIDGEVGGFIGPADIEHAASTLEPDSSAALLVWEDLWAKPLVDAMRRAGGVLVEGARIPDDLVQEALSEPG
jgi:Family of unknown function (DUF6325)